MKIWRLKLLTLAISHLFAVHAMCFYVTSSFGDYDTLAYIYWCIEEYPVVPPTKHLGVVDATRVSLGASPTIWCKKSWITSSDFCCSLAIYVFKWRLGRYVDSDGFSEDCLFLHFNPHVIWLNHPSGILYIPINSRVNDELPVTVRFHGTNILRNSVRAPLISVS